MDDLYCPSCGLVLNGRATLDVPAHCPRCAARHRRGEPGAVLRIALVARPPRGGRADATRGHGDAVAR
jgi:hypothetical protein